MKCYYEELGIERDANESEIKAAYRKLALKWHPDKNPSCLEKAKERFQLIQQAYEVLLDPQERAWYDNHREQILRGKNSEYEDNCLDVFQYFTVSCFKGYGDDDNGFYAVYRNVFNKIAAEDVEFMTDRDIFLNIPNFGSSESSYEDVVAPFYAFWSAYCTKRSYTWLCPYDIRDVKHRKILREIEKDMKKVVQKAKKERNDEVRNLVSFIRKRDKRIQAYKKLLEERSALNRQKHEQNRLEQRRRRQQELEEMTQNSLTINQDDDYENKLKLLEQEYSSGDEYYEKDDDVVEQDFENEEYIHELHCVACNKNFKTEKALANHGLSRKHHDNSERLKIVMQAEEHLFEAVNSEKESGGIETTYDTNSSENEDNKSAKIKDKKIHKKGKRLVLPNSEDDINESVNISKKVHHLDNIDTEDEDWNKSNKKSTRKIKNKLKTSKIKEKSDNSKTQPECDSETINKHNFVLGAESTQVTCITCNSKFESKNKLFSHLKLTNHGVFLPKTKLKDEERAKYRKGKGKGY